MLGEAYQKALIILGLAAAVLFGIFTYKELFPEYKEYQNLYLELEAFKSSKDGTPMPFFKKGIKQIVISAQDNGPERIDRCQSCHVALDFPHFSPQKVARDINGQVRIDQNGKPILVKNDTYIWDKLDQEILSLRDEKANQKLLQEGKEAEVANRLEKANQLNELKFITINGKKVEASKVLSMHPLLGNETSPFELHSLEDYGCSSCHSGNGRALTFNRAHGPLFDGDYKTEAHAEKPVFLEVDEDNDPLFSKMLNDKPGPELLFQTEPVLVGSLIEANCYNCHETQKNKLNKAALSIEGIENESVKNYEQVYNSIEQDKGSLKQLLSLLLMLEAEGYDKAVETLSAEVNSLELPSSDIEEAKSQLSFINKQNKHFSSSDSDRQKTKKIAYIIKAEIESLVGVDGFRFLYAELRKENSDNLSFKLHGILENKLGKLGSDGTLIQKFNSLPTKQEQIKQLSLLSSTVKDKVERKDFLEGLENAAEKSMGEILTGEQLFFSQACYSCHMIERVSKGNVGPELTKIGLSYPWYIKESIVWPQGNLKTSTMPNFRLDHEEVEDLLGFLLSQKGYEANSKDSLYHYKTSKKAWEAGALQPWEKPLSPDSIKNLGEAQVIFATEGCASCHILKGFESKVGFNNKGANSHKKSAYLDKLYENKHWFSKVFPKNVLGSQIANLVKSQATEIDRRISLEANPEGILDEIEKKHPGVTDSFYNNFKFAARSRNKEFKDRLASAYTDLEKEHIEKEKAVWNERLYKVKMMYIQEYGYGREVGPNLHYSGVYRDEEWLIGHFKNPQAYAPKSIMPVMPFDDTKFYALTHMLQELGRKNQKELQEYWEHSGFSPEEAFSLHCASCHGDSKKGNGIVAEMIYPIPKNLTSPAFLRNLTKERVVDSIMHGVEGTPMAPWSNLALDNSNQVLNRNQAEAITDWLFLNLPGEDFINSKESILKWNYSPRDIVQELQKQKIEDKPQKIEDIFDVTKAGNNSIEPYSYMLKEELYTSKNIEEGQEFFILNCAQCHGREAEGNGNRAEAMVEAKPRALTNIPWINSRDDLRLLRSIKFGVQGTSMTPWGDRTSSLQRMQLVLYLRQMNQEKDLRNKLSKLIYHSLEESIIAVRKAQGDFYGQLSKAQQVYQEATKVKDKLLVDVANRESKNPTALHKAFEEEVKALQILKDLELKNVAFEQLLSLLDEEKALVRKIASSFISSDNVLGIGEKGLLFLSKQPKLFSYKNGKFILAAQVTPDKAYFQQKEEIIQYLEKKLVKLKAQKEATASQLPRHEKTEALETLSQQISLTEELKKEFVLKLELILKTREKQSDIFKNKELI